MGSENLTAGLHIATVVAPVAVYFLLLGLLNSRRHPQLLRARWDFALLLGALSPLLLLPLLGRIGLTPLTVLAAAGLVVLVAYLLAPRGPAWVIYNISLDDAGDALQRALERMGYEVRRKSRRLDILGQDTTIELGAFPLLRNVSVRLKGGPASLASELETRLAAGLTGICVETSPMAVSLLLVATAMLVVPATLMVHHAVDIVRVLTDLLP